MNTIPNNLSNVADVNLYTWSTGGNVQGTMVEGMMTFWDPTGQIAAYIPDGIDLARIQMLLDPSEGDDAFAQYFNSTWFPLVRAPLGGDCMAALANKVNTVSPERLADYVKVIKSHWQSIEDNFKWPLPTDFDDAVKQEQNLAVLQYAPPVETAKSIYAFQIKAIDKHGAVYHIRGPALRDQLSIPQEIYAAWQPKVGGWIDLEPVFGVRRGVSVGDSTVYRDNLKPRTAGDFDGDRLVGQYQVVENAPLTLTIPIPEGATHYQDASCSEDGALRFFKKQVGGMNPVYYIWGINNVGTGNLKWIEYNSELLRNRPMLQIESNESIRRRGRHD